MNARLITTAVVSLCLGAGLAWLARPTPAPEPAASPTGDAELVRSLLAEGLGKRRFDFPTIARACSGKQVIPLDGSPPHQRIVSTIESALAATLADLSSPDSPVRQHRRINEASRHFEDALLARINATPGLTCDIPPNRNGTRQRSGYPDLRVTDTATGTVFYLDPKLLEQGSARSTLRSFYFAPKTKTLKITDDAVHLLVGIEHDGKPRQWTFTGWRIVDLSTLDVRLKTEFQASNADLYQNTEAKRPGGNGDHTGN